MKDTYDFWANQVADNHYYLICFLAKLQKLTGTRPPSEIVDIVDWCSKCRYSKVCRKTAEIICRKGADGPLDNKCKFFLRTAEDQQTIN